MVFNGISSPMASSSTREELRNVVPMPNTLISWPAMAGPNSWPALNTVVNSATALAMSLRSTITGTAEVRAGKPIEKEMPLRKEMANICQTWITSTMTKTAKNSNTVMLNSSA